METHTNNTKENKNKQQKINDERDIVIGKSQRHFVRKGSEGTVEIGLKSEVLVGREVYYRNQK